MGNARPTRLPVWEMVFGSMPESLAAIATRKVKWDKRYQQKYGITTRAAQDLAPVVVARLDKLSRRIYRALGLRAHGFPRDRSGRGLRARSQRQSQSRSRRGLCRIGARCRDALQ